jgi:hypothetical protein
VEIAVHKWLQMQEPNFSEGGIFKVMPSGTYATLCLGIMFESNDTSVE